MSAIITIPFGDIEVGARMHLLREATVVALMQSISTVGLLNPISVTKEGRNYRLIAGAHRLEAVKRLKIYDRVEARQVSVKDVDLMEIAEIDENLIRNIFSPAQTAILVDLRKTLYEKRHPETKHGGTPGGGRGKKKAHKDANLASFGDETATKTGHSKRTVERDATRGKEGREWLGKVVGTPLDQGDEIDALIKLTKPAREELLERAKTGEKVSAKTEAKKLGRQEKEQNLAAKQVALPEKRYGVIYADPEWRFEVYSRDSGLGRAADNHYHTTATEELCSRPVGGIAADDCVLFLWATAPMLPDALRVMEAWGFTYKSQCIWAKDKIGTGFWFRNKHEILLVGTRGNVPAPAPGTQWASLLDAPVGKHSAKPEKFYELIESYFPNLPKIELNARASRPGWDAWGHEAPKQAVA